MSMTNTLTKSAIEERKDQTMPEDVTKTNEYAKMYADYIRGRVDAREMRGFIEKRMPAQDVTITTNMPAGKDVFPYPTVLQQYVETAWATYGKFSRLVSESFEPAVLNIPVEAEADGAHWHIQGENGPTSESITFGQIMLQPQMIKKWVMLTDELMAMTSDEFLRYIADELVYRVYLALDEAIINRDGSNGGVNGIINSALTDSANVDLGFNAINTAIASLVTFDNLTIAMNPATFFNNFMGLTDLQGLPIFRIAQDNEGRPAYYLNGYRVEFTQALPSYDTATTSEAWAVVGDFRRGYRLNYPQGRNVITMVDPYTKMTEDVVRMLGRLYVAGDVIRPKHFVALYKTGE